MEAAQGVSVEQIWQDDLLGRQADAEFLIRLLTNRAKERNSQGRVGSFVLNIDAGWGSGKTFFLYRMKRSLESRGYLVALINAWADDHADDPLLSVMSAIDAAVAPRAFKSPKVQHSLKSLKTTTQRIAVAAARGAATQLAKRVIGDAADVIAAEFGIESDNKVLKGATASAESQANTLMDSKAKSLLDSFNETKRSIETFKKQLDDLLKKAIANDGKQRPMFVLIDELDRCRPPYAIALLERIKHLFEIDNIVFIVATDTKQLCHAIGAVYGVGFDSSRYLGRFFDQTYSFEAVSREEFIAHLLKKTQLPKENISLPPNIKAEEYLAGALDYFGLKLRDIEQVCDMLANVVTAWDLALKIELAVLLPLIVGQQQKLFPSLSKEFNDALNGLAKGNGGNLEAWSIQFAYSGREVVSGQALFNDFVGHISHDLVSVTNIPVSAGYSRWVQSRLNEEFTVLHNSRYFPERPPYSIIMKYPEFVRSAGRLTPAKAS